MKVGMNLLLWTGGVTEEHIPLLSRIKSWGFDGVELPMFNLDGSPWTSLATAMNDIGLGRTVVAVLPEGANLVSDETKERKAALEYLKRCVDISAEMGVETVAGPIYSPVGRLVGRGPTDEEWDRCVTGLTELGEHAQGSGVAISVEPLNRFETYVLNAQGDAAKVTERTGLKNVGILYDTFHANIEEKDIGAAIRGAGSQINHVHVSANDRATPGEDHIDYVTNFKALKEIGYDGWLTIEAFGAWLEDLAGATCIWRKMAPSEEHLAKNGLEFVKKTWAAA